MGNGIKFRPKNTSIVEPSTLSHPQELKNLEIYTPHMLSTLKLIEDKMIISDYIC
jgi:hypothetical protein